MNRDVLLLADMRNACDKVAAYILEGKDAFLADDRTQDAVIRRLEIIGEATKQLSARAKAMAPNQPWKQIAGMRDKLIHQYFGVNLERVWETAYLVLPPFREIVVAMLVDVEQSWVAGAEGETR